MLRLDHFAYCLLKMNANSYIAKNVLIVGNWQPHTRLVHVKQTRNNRISDDRHEHLPYLVLTTMRTDFKYKFVFNSLFSLEQKKKRIRSHAFEMRGCSKFGVRTSDRRLRHSIKVSNNGESTESNANNKLFYVVFWSWFSVFVVVWSIPCDWISEAVLRCCRKLKVSSLSNEVKPTQ